MNHFISWPLQASPVSLLFLPRCSPSTSMLHDTMFWITKSTILNYYCHFAWDCIHFSGTIITLRSKSGTYYILNSRTRLTIEHRWVRVSFYHQDVSKVHTLPRGCKTMGGKSLDRPAPLSRAAAHQTRALAALSENLNSVTSIHTRQLL